MSTALADGLIAAAVAVVIALAIRYARRHPKIPPELAAYGHARLPRLSSGL